MASLVPAGLRCAVHPVRGAVDRCPVCERPRCAADAADPATGEGCAVCGGASSTPARRGPAPVERAVRSALASFGTALLGGVVAAQYVGAELFAYLTPFVVGVLVAAAAQAAAAGPRSGTALRQVRLVASTYAVLGVALGFALERSQDAVGSGALLPYAAAVAGVLLWTLPPKRRG